MKGYKGFYKEEGKLVCQDVNYVIGGEYEVEGDIELCKNGIHYCKDIDDVFRYYPHKDNLVVCEIEDIGDVREEGGNKIVTNKIRVVRNVTDRLNELCARHKYDEKGNMVYEKDSDGNEYKYDERGNVVYEKDSDGNEYKYDERGNKVYMKDCSGYVFKKT
jgi:YD repeat-containing protein